MRVASSCASARPAFMLCMPAGPVRCAASPASQTRPRPKDAASRRSKRTSIDQPISPARLANQEARCGEQVAGARLVEVGEEALAQHRREPALVAVRGAHLGCLELQAPARAAVRQRPERVHRVPRRARAAARRPRRAPSTRRSRRPATARPRRAACRAPAARASGGRRRRSRSRRGRTASPRRPTRCEPRRSRRTPSRAARPWP